VEYAKRVLVEIQYYVQNAESGYKKNVARIKKKIQITHAHSAQMKIGERIKCK